MMDSTGSLRLINSTFVWDIKDFTKIYKTIGERITSPYFAAGDIPLDKIKFYLHLYPFGDSNENENFLSLFLSAIFCSDVTELKVSFNLNLWNKNKNDMNTVKNGVTKFSKTHLSWGYSKFLDRNKDEFKNYFLFSTDSTLSIACSISSSCFYDCVDPYRELSQDFNTIFSSENLSDVIIQIDNKELKAHKIILSARSKVFSAMFKHNMTETNESIIKIEDISYDVMIEMLRFIYCGEVKRLNLLSGGLLSAADKYDLPSLKSICEEALRKNLNITSACETLSISNLYRSDTVKEAAIEFIIKNLKEVVDTEGFNKLSKDSKLCTEILRKISLKNIT